MQYPLSFETFSKWVNDPAFIDQLKEAAKDPKATLSIQLLSKLNVHISHALQEYRSLPVNEQLFIQPYCNALHVWTS